MLQNQHRMQANGFLMCSCWSRITYLCRMFFFRIWSGIWIFWMKIPKIWFSRRGLIFFLHRDCLRICCSFPGRGAAAPQLLLSLLRPCPRCRRDALCHLMPISTSFYLLWSRCGRTDLPGPKSRPFPVEAPIRDVRWRTKGESGVHERKEERRKGHEGWDLQATASSRQSHPPHRARSREWQMLQTKREQWWGHHVMSRGCGSVGELRHGWGFDRKLASSNR